MKLIGVVDFLAVDRSFGRVEPILESHDQGWRPAKASDFPPENRVFWSRPPVGLAAGSIVQVTVEGNVADKAKDHYKVASHQFCTEVVDLRATGDVEALRRAVDAGLKLFPPPQPHVMLWAKDGIVGPFKLVQTNGLWTIEETMRPQVGLYTPEELSMTLLSAKSGKRYILSASNPPLPSAQVDWGSDEDVLRRALTHAATHLKRDNANHALTRAAIAQAVADETVDGTQAQVALWSNRLARAEKYLAATKTLGTQAASLTELIQALPAFKRELEAALGGVREAAKARVEAELTAEKASLDAIRKEKAAVQKEREVVQAELETAKAKVRQEVEALEETLEERVRAAVEKPERLLADVAMFRAIGAPGSVGPSATPQTVPRTRERRTWGIAANQVRTLGELRSAIGRHAGALSVQLPACLNVHCAYKAGSFPLLYGPRAVEVAETYSRAVAGGRFTVVQVSPLFRQPSDLIGEVRNGRFVPHAAALVDVLSGAAGSEGLAVVVIEGVNRAPVESFLLPLLRLTSRRAETLPVFHPSAVDAGDAYEDASAIMWPANVILIGTAVDGPTSLPVPSQLWADAILIRCGIGSRANGSSPTPASATSDLTPDFRKSECAGGRDDAVLQMFATLETQDPTPAELLDSADVAARYSHALAACQADSRERLKEVVRACLIPPIASVAMAPRREELATAVEKAFTVPASFVLPLVESVRRSVA